MLDNVRQQHLGCHFRGRVWRNDAGIDSLTGGCHQIGHIVFADVARPVGWRLHQPLMPMVMVPWPSSAIGSRMSPSSRR